MVSVFLLHTVININTDLCVCIDLRVAMEGGSTPIRNKLSFIVQNSCTLLFSALCLNPDRYTRSYVNSRIVLV